LASISVSIVATTALRMAERIARTHNMRLARQPGINPDRLPEIWNVVSRGDP
jgi:hypothetical protein